MAATKRAKTSAATVPKRKHQRSSVLAKPVDEDDGEEDGSEEDDGEEEEEDEDGEDGEEEDNEDAEDEVGEDGEEEDGEDAEDEDDEDGEEEDGADAEELDTDVAEEEALDGKDADADADDGEDDDDDAADEEEAVEAIAAAIGSHAGRPKRAKRGDSSKPPITEKAAGKRRMQATPGKEASHSAQPPIARVLRRRT